MVTVVLTVLSSSPDSFLRVCLKSDDMRIELAIKRGSPQMIKMILDEMKNYKSKRVEPESQNPFRPMYLDSAVSFQPFNN